MSVSVPQIRTCTKAVTPFFAALCALVVCGASVLAAVEPAAKASSPPADELSAISKDIQQLVRGVGYTDDTDINLVQIISRWDYNAWKQSLSQAKADYEQKKISGEQAAQADVKVLSSLCDAIKKEFIPAAADSEYFYLSKVVNDKTAQFLGYSQLLYVFGNSLGLTIKVADVLETASGPLPAGEEHAACLAELIDGRSVFVDLTQDGPSKPFLFRDQYAAAGNYWELKQKENPLKLPRRIQILDKSGILADIYNGLGNSSAKSGKNSDSLSYFSKAADTYPKMAKAFSSRGAELFSAGQRSKAAADFEKAIQLDPKDAEAYFNRGTMYVATGQGTKGLADFAKAVELKPVFAAAYKSRGNVYLKTGQTAEAIADLSKALELDPKDAEVCVFLGMAYDKAGKSDKAVAYLTRAIELNPKYAAGYNMRGIEYAKLKRFTDAISDFIRASDLDPNFADAYYNRALAYVQLDQHQSAITNFSKAIDLSPRHASAYYYRGVMYQQLRKYEEARSDFNRTVQLQPKNAAAYLHRAIANVQLNKNEDAKKDLKKAGELDPTLKDEIKKIADSMK
jgi:tetratricopeptide (TPR) repeat protein